MKNKEKFQLNKECCCWCILLLLFITRMLFSTFWMSTIEKIKFSKLCLNFLLKKLDHFMKENLSVLDSVTFYLFKLYQNTCSRMSLKFWKQLSTISKSPRKRKKQSLKKRRDGNLRKRLLLATMKENLMMMKIFHPAQMMNREGRNELKWYEISIMKTMLRIRMRIRILKMRLQ